MPTLRTWFSRSIFVGISLIVFIYLFSFILFYFVIFVAFYARWGICFLCYVHSFSLTLTFLLWLSKKIILGKTDSSDVV